MEENEIQTDNPPARRRFRWKMSDSVRQLIIIVIGILITFQGSSWIESTKLRRQSREMLSMIETEMNGNMSELLQCSEMLQFEIDGMDFFARWAGDIRNAPQDSVVRYRAVLEMGLEFLYESNAFEVMKTSPSTTLKMDKEMMRKIFTCYSTTDRLMRSVNNYYRSKYELVGNFFYNAERQNIQAAQRGDVYPYVEAYINSSPTGNLIFAAVPNLDPRKKDVDKLIEQYREVLAQLSRYTGKN